jgi:hypothetical protein
MSGSCVVCHHGNGPVCPTDLRAIDDGLAALPARLNAVARRALVPSQSGPVERGSKRVHAGLPAGVDALSMIGPGGEVTVRLHPLVRHWSAKRKVLVTTHVVGHARQVEVEVTDWFHEAVIGADGRPVLVPADDDQVGTAPPREWLDVQARAVRAYFGHHVPARTMLGQQRPYVPPVYRTLLRTAAGPQVVAFLAVCSLAAGAGARMKYLGLLSYQDPSPDLERGRGPNGMQWDIDYLRTWLPKAFETEAVDAAAIAAQLHTLHAEIDRVLGETPDREWIGRCPAFIADVDADGQPAGRKKPCGGALWQDNTAFTAQVTCPRCRSTWDTRGQAGVGTAREIRKVWPVDRRRRYHADDIDRLTTPACPACKERVRISWREVTGTRDVRRWWQPVSASCVNGCDDARRTL